MPLPPAVPLEDPLDEPLDPLDEPLEPLLPELPLE
jgi:hypothetical protein